MVADDAGGNAVLELEELVDRAVVLLRPDGPVLAGIDQVDGDPQLLEPDGGRSRRGRSARQLGRDLANIREAVAVGQRGVASDDEQRPILRQRADDVLGNALRRSILPWDRRPGS